MGAYLVLARKHRPQSFADIVGQEHVVRTLRNAIELGRVHHAFLFAGARGVGKTTAARVLARALNCEKGPTPTPCGVCPTCVEILNGSSTDVHEIDGASNTGVDHIRELRENLRYMPRGRYKLYIIDEVHMLSQAAFNALLKTLEEPPAHVKFVFATTEPQKIPVTILSRCQRFDFRRVGNAQLMQHLCQILEAEGSPLLNAEDAVLPSIVREAQGSVRDALSLLDQVLSFVGQAAGTGAALDAAGLSALGFVDRQVIFQLVDAVLDRDARALLNICADIDARGHDLGHIAGLLVEHWRDAMVAVVVSGGPSGDSSTVLERSTDEQAQLAAQGGRVGAADLHRYFALTVGVAEDVSRSPYPRVSFEMGLLRLLEVAPTHTVGELLQRLDDLVTAGGGGATLAPRPGRSTAAGKRTGADPAANAAEPSAAKSPSPLSEVFAAAPPAATRVAPAPPVLAPARGSPTDRGEWPAAVAAVRQKNPALASVLEHAEVQEWSAELVRLAFPADTFYLEAARDPENQTVLRQALVGVLSSTVQFDVVERAGAATSTTLAQRNEVAREAALQRSRQQARQAPAVLAVARILGGEVRSVETSARD